MDSLAAPTVPLRRNLDFNLLWTGQAVSALGSQIAEIAYPLLILAVTGSAAQAGLVGTALLAAHVAALLPAGVVADHHSRKRIMVVSSLVQAGAVATVVVAVAGGQVRIGHLVVVGVVQGAAAAFFAGASRGAVRRVVPASQLTTALSRIQARDFAAYLVGPPIGGALFAVARVLPFACDTVSFLAVAAAAALVCGRVDAHRDGPVARPPLRRGITLGMRFVFGSPYLRTVAIWAAVVNATATGLLLMMVVLARQRGAGPEAIGVIMATGSVGGLCGALFATRLIALLPARRMVLVASWTLTACPVGMVLAPSPWFLGAAAALAMLAMVPVNVVLIARATALTPHAMQAQVSNALMLTGSGLKWAAPLGFGVLADRFGPVPATLVGAGLYVAAAVWLQGRTVLRQVDDPVVPVTG